MSEIYNKLAKERFCIAIPSRERSFLVRERRGIWRYIDPTNNKYNVSLITRASEVEDYTVNNMGGVSMNPVHEDYTIADKRNSAMEFAMSIGLEYLFIIDDDVAFYYRDENLSSKYTSHRANFENGDCFNKIIWESMCLCSDEYPVIGLPLKQGSFTLKYMFPKNIPVIRFVCYHVPTLAREGIYANGLGTTFMSDRYVHLSLLDRGYRSLSNCRYAIGDYGTGYKGGCSTTRTAELQSEAAKALVNRFPKQVSIKIKEDGLWDTKRLDCVIKWKQFLDPGESVYLPSFEGLKLIGEEPT